MAPVASRPQRPDRLDLLARLLRDRPGITAAAAARVLGVSIRTVFRDIDHLRERGHPVEGGRGRGGGLRIHASWGLGRILLTSEEALGTLLGLAVVEKLGFPMFGAAMARARRKVVDAFPESERRRIGPLRERVFVGAPASPAVRASYAQPAAAVVAQLQAAFIAERVVTTEYEKEGAATAMRRLEPHALVINWPAWYVLGFDEDRQAARTFRFDRFRSAVVDERRFKPRPRDLAADLLRDPRVALDSL